MSAVANRQVSTSPLELKDIVFVGATSSHSSSSAFQRRKYHCGPSVSTQKTRLYSHPDDDPVDGLRSVSRPTHASGSSLRSIAKMPFAVTESAIVPLAPSPLIRTLVMSGAVASPARSVKLPAAADTAADVRAAAPPTT